MKKTQDISICVLTYNHELYIKECIDSILQQEGEFTFEIIIADDFSTDNNRSILASYQASHPDLIRLILPDENRGVMNTVSVLMKAASGKYIALCEGDDYWIDNQKLAKQKAVLDANPNYSMVCTNRYICEQDGRLVADRAYMKEVYTIEDIVNGFIPGTQTMMLRNFDSLPVFLARNNRYYSGDRYISYFCSLLGDIFRLQDFTSVYRRTASGIWSQIPPIEKLRLTFEQMVEFHQSIGVPSENAVSAKKGFETSLSFLLYSMKRPKLLLKKENWNFILAPYKLFAYMNRTRLLYNALRNRVKSNKRF